MTKEELTRNVTAAASVVKLVTAVGNNAAWYVALDAFDHIKHHRNYNHCAAGGHTVKYHYKRALKAFKDYERRLVHATEYRMFCVADMADETRKKYGDITDRDYYEFWAGIGAKVYEQTKPLITSLWNKYRVSLLNHNIPQADIMAWPMVAQACLELAVLMYENALITLREDYHVPTKLARMVFEQLSLKPIAKMWQEALTLTDPMAMTYDLDTTEEKNITHGLEQLSEAWTNPKTMYQSTFQTVVDYEEVFRTAGEMKKAMREISEMKEAVS